MSTEPIYLREPNPTQQVLNALPEDTVKGPHTFTTSNGIQFHIKPVSPYIGMDAAKNIPAPEVPMVPAQDGRDILIENPDDPAYKRAVNEYRARLAELSNAILLTRGTELILPLPEGVDSPESEEWADDLREFAGLEIPASGRRRYYAWLKYIALSNSKDFIDLYWEVASASGITKEADVVEAIANFRNNQARGTDTGDNAVEEAGHADSDSAGLSGASA